MFEVYDREGRRICECPVEDTARERLASWPTAHYIQEVVTLRRLVATKEESHAEGEQEASKAPF